MQTDCTEYILHEYDSNADAAGNCQLDVLSDYELGRCGNDFQACENTEKAR